jgi:hypothetical protein
MPFRGRRRLLLGLLVPGAAAGFVLVSADAVTVSTVLPLTARVPEGEGTGAAVDPAAVVVAVAEAAAVVTVAVVLVEVAITIAVTVVIAIVITVTVPADQGHAVRALRDQCLVGRRVDGNVLRPVMQPRVSTGLGRRPQSG